TDHLTWSGRDTEGHANYMPEGSGLSALKKFLEMENGGQAPTDQEIYDYIKANHEEFNKPGDTRGGDDIIRGGAGDDIIYGQGGDDLIIGGHGDDVIYGGAGDDTFKWEEGDAGEVGAPAIDTIMDFGLGGSDPAGKDTLDPAELL